MLGHVQRGGTPTSFDRVLATRFGLHATIAAHEGEHGQMVALRGTEIELVPLAKAVATAEDGEPVAAGRDRRLHRLSSAVRQSCPSTVRAAIPEREREPTRQGYVRLVRCWSMLLTRRRIKR